MNEERTGGPRDEEPRSERTGIGMAVGAGIGIAVGTGIGLALDNLARGIGIGVAIGTAIGAGLGAQRSGRNDERDRTDG